MQAALLGLRGYISNVSVKLVTERTDIHLTNQVNHMALIQAVEKVEFDVLATTIELAVKGMVCAAFQI